MRRLLLLLIGAAWAASCGSGEEPEPREPTGASTSVAGAASDGEVDRLRALGYVDVAVNADASSRPGVRAHDPERAQPGLTYFTNAHGCSSQLIRADGSLVHRWHLEPCFVWGNTVLLENGDVLAIHREPADGPGFAARARARELVRIDRDGRVLWRRRMPVHHDVELTPDGRVVTLTERHRELPEVNATIPVRDHVIVLLSGAGEILEEVSLFDVLRASSDVLPLQEVKPGLKHGVMEIDLIHANSVEWMRRPELAARGPLYAPGNLLVCLRNQDAVAILDWERRRLVWAWGRGELSGPHDATLLANGNVLVFDNGLERKASRVVEVDPTTGEIVWEYRPPEPGDLFTVTRGAAQRLPNGDTLVTDSEAGRIFEVTREGDLVWDFRNPNRSDKGQPILVVRARRLPGPVPESGPYPRSD